MGTMQMADCQCGFKQEVVVGGGMRDYYYFSAFPFYCACCGLVNVNTEASELFCPKCGSKDVQKYGRPPISLPMDDSDPPAIMATLRHQAYKTGNLCPACKQMTLVFHAPHILFD